MQIWRPADPAEVPRVGERRGHGDRVGRLATPVQVKDRVEDRRMGRPVEVTGLEDLHDVGDGVLGQQHPAEYALLGGDVLGRRTVVGHVVRPRLGGPRLREPRLDRPRVVGDRHR